MERQDYPALFQAADAASLEGQRSYARLLWSELALTILGAALGSLYPAVAQENRVPIALLTAVALTGALIMKLVNRFRGDDKNWFDGRAVAETTKSETWRYMMRVPPYDNDASCEPEFIRSLQEIQDARRQVPLDVGSVAPGSGQITEKMRSVRGLPIADRRAFYTTHRIADQADWYQRRAKSNALAASAWFWASLTAQVAALVAAIVRVQSAAGGGLSLISLFAALAAAFTAWSQSRRHDELRRAYPLAFQELATMRSLVERAETEEALRQAVDGGEGACSREHTMWMAKRSEPLRARPG